MAGSRPERHDDSGGAVCSRFDRLGGEHALRAIIGDFIDRVFADRMIGFFFRNANESRVKEMEYQLAAEFLGSGTRYSGLPLRQVHGKHPIMGGHFARRKQILRETLVAHGVAADIIQAWLKHVEDLRPQITKQSGSGCQPLTDRNPPVTD